MFCLKNSPARAELGCDWLNDDEPDGREVELKDDEDACGWPYDDAPVGLEVDDAPVGLDVELYDDGEPPVGRDVEPDCRKLDADDCPAVLPVGRDVDDDDIGRLEPIAVRDGELDGAAGEEPELSCCSGWAPPEVRLEDDMPLVRLVDEMPLEAMPLRPLAGAPEEPAPALARTPDCPPNVKPLRLIAGSCPRRRWSARRPPAAALGPAAHRASFASRLPNRAFQLWRLLSLKQQLWLR